MQTKVSTSQLRATLQTSSTLLKRASARIRELEQQNNTYRRREEAAKIASSISEKNLSPSWGSSEADMIEQIMNMEPEKVAAVQAAVDMAAPHDPFAYIEEENGSDTGHAKVAGASSFEQFVLGNID